MNQIDVRAAVVGVLVALGGYLVSFVMVAPALAGSLLALGDVGTAIVLTLVQLGLLVLVGALVASRQRRRFGLDTRTAAVRTALTAGAVGLTIVLVLGAAAAAATSAPGLTPGILLTNAVVWLGGTALGSLLVAPGPARGPAYADRSTRIPARADREAGEATLEHLGVTVVAVLLITALLAVMTPAGRWLTDNIKAGLCQIVTLGQGPCEAPISLQAASHKPTDPCVLSTSNDVRQASVQVTFISVKGGGTIRVEELSDRTFRVSAEGNGGVGVTEGLGGGVSLTINDSIHGGEAQLQGAAYLEAAGGATWKVNAQEKDKLVNYLKDERNWATVQAGLSSTPVVGPAATGVTWAGKELWNWLTGNDYTPPQPDELYAQAGIGADGSASAASIAQGASVSAAASTALGSRVNIKTGQTTLYYATTVSGAAAATQGYGPVEGGIAQAEGQVKVLVAVTIDTEGNPVKVATQGLAVGNAKATANSLFLGELANERASGGALLNASVEITGPETQRIALDLLQATGITQAGPVGQARSAYDALSTFTAAARDRGILTSQAVQTDSDTAFGIQAGGAIGPVALGGSFKNSTDTVTSGEASYFDGTGWRPWTDCAA
ncbi:hypothetical protein ASD16_02180 [Cellulomonas sp. Root485]|uniref:hypothetical protein n=1 Tax=Cellulomonas sp. Root485 TaxID=1736546 RepID=UPI0007022194|nr:hypothetical protein [Cellulomonas sp. Root485]KQY24376.1 hypothetical protein ASD16_02180 [Cellulomonas sp. Root485]